MDIFVMCCSSTISILPELDACEERALPLQVLQVIELQRNLSIAVLSHLLLYCVTHAHTHTVPVLRSNVRWP